MPESWEIWWVRVKFEDSEECKVRPVIVLEDAVAYIISLKVTSHAPRIITLASMSCLIGKRRVYKKNLLFD
ncbi:MAG: hypothetical protein SOY70_02835 [Veillonellaceae bacterium]|nr:hypothetical protein [Veillonellaceae bacterium]